MRYCIGGYPDVTSSGCQNGATVTSLPNACLVERFISAKMLDQGRAHALDDQHAMEALVRFTNDELKHQELFRRVEQMIADQMPLGYRQTANPSDVARAVLAASTWAVLALTCDIELFVQSHYVLRRLHRNENKCACDFPQ